MLGRWCGALGYILVAHLTGSPGLDPKAEVRHLITALGPDPCPFNFADTAYCLGQLYTRSGSDICTVLALCRVSCE